MATFSVFYAILSLFTAQGLEQSENRVANYAVSVILNVVKNLFMQAETIMQTLTDSSLRSE